MANWGTNYGTIQEGWITAKEAARLTGYNRQYINRLIVLNKIIGDCSQYAGYCDKESILEWKMKHHR